MFTHRLSIIRVTLAAAVFLAPPCFTQEVPITHVKFGVSSGKLAGVVLNSTSSAIPNAAIRVHFNRPGAVRVSQLVPPHFNLGDLRLKTNSLGQFAADVTPGLYDITVLANGYDSQTHKIVVVPEAGTAAEMFWLVASDH